MMRVPPIPLPLLPDRIDVRVPVESDWGGAHEKEAQRINLVRFEEASALETRGYALADGSKGLIFVDGVNSDGAFAIPVNSLVSVNGGPEMAVVGCSAFCDLGRTHHWEVEVR